MADVAGRAVVKVCHSRQSDEWTTPQALFDGYGPFDVDAAANFRNHLCPVWFGPESPYAADALHTSWSRYGTHVWCNPPYSQWQQFVSKAHAESQAGVHVTLLLPARTDTVAWHTYIWPPNEHTTIEFLRGRVKFGEAKQGAPFPSVVVRFR
jgi:site-specific DNA-methyltransferase (adenine-specific)